MWSLPQRSFLRTVALGPSVGLLGLPYPWRLIGSRQCSRFGACDPRRWARVAALTCFSQEVVAHFTPKAVNPVCPQACSPVILLPEAVAGSGWCDSGHGELKFTVWERQASPELEPLQNGGALGASQGPSSHREPSPEEGRSPPARRPRGCWRGLSAPVPTLPLGRWTVPFLWLLSWWWWCTACPGPPCLSSGS